MFIFSLSRFLADRFVEGTCPICSYQVGAYYCVNFVVCAFIWFGHCLHRMQEETNVISVVDLSMPLN